MIKGSIQQEDTAIVKIYKPQKVYLYTKQILTNIEKLTVTQ